MHLKAKPLKPKGKTNTRNERAGSLTTIGHLWKLLLTAAQQARAANRQHTNGPTFNVASLYTQLMSTTIMSLYMYMCMYMCMYMSHHSCQTATSRRMLGHGTVFPHPPELQALPESPGCIQSLTLTGKSSNKLPTMHADPQTCASCTSARR